MLKFVQHLTLLFEIGYPLETNNVFNIVGGLEIKDLL